MGFARRAVRKSVRRATPRPVRQAMHPARTARNAVTPRPVKQISRGAYTVRHPVGAAENKVIGSVLYPPRTRRHRRGPGPWFAVVGVLLGLIMLAVLPWYVPVLIIVAAIAVPVIARRRTGRG